MTDREKFYHIADVVVGKATDADTYAMIVEAAERGYNLRAIEDLEPDA